MNINSFNDYKNHIEIFDENLLNVLWIIDGTIVSGDSIRYIIDQKKFDILDIKKINQENLSAIYVNKNWHYAIIVSTNDCLNKYK